MKKIILSLLCIAAIGTTAKAQLAIAPELGLNMANITGKSDGTTVNTKMKAGIGLGAVIDLGLTDNIYFQPGLFYEMTGCSFTDEPTGKYSINTITIPLNFEYKTGKEGGNRFFVGIGPYIAVNFSGTYSFDALGGYSSGSSGSLKIGSAKTDPNTGTGGDDVKALDLGAGINIGYLVANGFYFRLHYQIGFTNLDPDGDANNTMYSSAFGATVGFYLNSKKISKAGTIKK